MSNHVSFVEIENFKSIKKLRLDTKRINILVGKPNVGKSNILEAMSLLGASYANASKHSSKMFSQFIRYDKIKNLFYDQNNRTNIKIETNKHLSKIEMKSSWNPQNYAFVMLEDKNDINKLTQEIDDISEEINNFHQLIIRKPESKSLYSCEFILNEQGNLVHSSSGLNIHSNPFKKYDYSNNVEFGGNYYNFLIPPYGENLIAVMMNYSDFRKKVYPFFEQYGLELLIDTEDNVLEVQKKVDGLSYKIPYSLTADTLRRIIFYLAAILSNKDSVIMLEEPEAHAFPPYVSMLAEKIVHSKTNQFFIATHSPYLIHKIIEEAEEGEVALFHVDYKDYQTTATLISDEEIANIYENGVDIFSIIR